MKYVFIHTPQFSAWFDRTRTTAPFYWLVDGGIKACLKWVLQQGLTGEPHGSDRY